MTEHKRGMRTCRVCGRDFALMHEDRYTVRNVMKSGLMTAFGSETEPIWWDAFDCPYCGCQNHVNERRRPVEEQEDDCPLFAEYGGEEDGR